MSTDAIIFWCNKCVSGIDINYGMYKRNMNTSFEKLFNHKISWTVYRIIWNYTCLVFPVEFRKILIFLSVKCSVKSLFSVEPSLLLWRTSEIVESLHFRRIYFIDVDGTCFVRVKRSFRFRVTETLKLKHSHEFVKISQSQLLKFSETYQRHNCSKSQNFLNLQSFRSSKTSKIP